MENHHGLIGDTVHLPSNGCFCFSIVKLVFQGVEGLEVGDLINCNQDPEIDIFFTERLCTMNWSLVNSCVSWSFSSIFPRLRRASKGQDYCNQGQLLDLSAV